MPANSKYLTQSISQKVIKISSGIIGGYIISAMLHIALSLWLPFHKEILITSIYTLFLSWVTLLIVPFLFKNAWKILALYIIASLLLAVIIYFGRSYYSFV
ncbi:hypothetical protein OAT18_03655 [Tenacibaculum sp.]|nr:hypothetical protein [Tenacibaculum sp.]